MHKNKVIIALCVLIVFAFVSFLTQDGWDSPPLKKVDSMEESSNAVEGDCSSCPSVGTRNVVVGEDEAVTLFVGENVPPENEEATTSPPPLREDGNTAQKVNYIFDTPPIVAWDVDKSILTEISKNQDISAFERTKAYNKLRFRFAEWRGRKRGRLGGFCFDLSKFSMLEGWTENERTPPELDWGKRTCIIQRVSLVKGESRLNISIRVAVSVGLAQYLLMRPAAEATNGLSHVGWWGDLHGVEVGDVWVGDSNIQKSNYHSGGFQFTRRNIIVGAYFHNGPKHGEPKNNCRLNLMSLARKLDRQIIEQGIAGSKWQHIASHCPKITQFEAESNTLTVGGDTFSPYEKDRAKAGSKNYSLVKFKVEPEQDGDKVSWVGDGAVRMILKYAIPYADTGYLEPNYLDNNPNTAKVWLVAINERNLLFSIAEIEFTLVKPD